MNEPQDQHRYFAYLLRMWQTNEGDASVWHASLENPHTGERLGFADLDRLCTFLKDQCDSLDHSFLNPGEDQK